MSAVVIVSGPPAFGIASIPSGSRSIPISGNGVRGVCGDESDVVAGDDRDVVAGPVSSSGSVAIGRCISLSKDGTSRSGNGEA